jgi:phosphate transport system ATP-binding protein
MFDTDVVRVVDESNGYYSKSTDEKQKVVVNHPLHDSEIVVVETQDLSVRYGKQFAIENISMKIAKNKVTTLIGPSGCGKSTFLRCLNRMNDRIPSTHMCGKVLIEGKNIFHKRVDLIALRRRIGMVFQKPNPFPMSIFDNVALAPRMHYGLKGKELDAIVEKSLKKAALWDEVKDNLKKKSGLELSGGQQQRLCIARTLAIQPNIILMDEPCSALDPISTYHIEGLIRELADEYTLIVVTHNLHQASRISDYTGFFMLGRLVEYESTEKLFQAPKERETEDYVSGRFG